MLNGRKTLRKRDVRIPACWEQNKRECLRPKQAHCTCDKAPLASQPRSRTPAVSPERKEPEGFDAFLEQLALGFLFSLYFKSRCVCLIPVIYAAEPLEGTDSLNPCAKRESSKLTPQVLMLVVGGDTYDVYKLFWPLLAAESEAWVDYLSWRTEGSSHGEGAQPYVPPIHPGGNLLSGTREQGRKEARTQNDGRRGIGL